jgi:tetratricopeptide (TPR) repeat protein
MTERRTDIATFIVSAGGLMKKAIFILIVLILPLLYYMGVFSRKETLPFSKEFFSVEMSPSSDHVPESKGTGNSKPGAGSRILPSDSQDLDRLYELKLDRGIRNLPIHSFALIREARKARREGRPDQAIRLALYAKKFSPDLPEPCFELARARWSENPFQLHQILPEFFKGEIVRFRLYPNSLIFLYDVFYILANATLLAFVVFGVVVMVNYLPLYLYDIRKNLTREASRLFTNSIRILLLLVPFFLRLDILWAILFWSALLWGYGTKRERQLIVVFLIVLVYVPFFLRSSSSFLDGLSSDILIEMNRANHEDGDRSTEQKLRNWLVSHPDDPQVLFTLGLMEKRQGNFAQAEDLYQRALHLDPQFDEASSNLGNVFLARKEPDLAIASYLRAVALNPDKGSYYYNLYRAYSEETFLSGKTAKAFEQARQFDAGTVNFYISIDSPNLNRRVIDEMLSAKRLWGRFLAQFIGREGILFRLFNAWFEKVPSRVSFLVPVLFLGFLIGMARYCRSRRFFTRCPMCGSPTYRFYVASSDREFVCFNCYRIFIQKEKLHAKIAEKKSLQAKEFQRQNRLVGRFVSLFFCGFGDLWNGRPIQGLLFLFVFFIFVLRFVYWNGVIRLSTPDLGWTFWPAFLWGGAFVVFYAIVLRRILRPSPRLRPRPEREGIS